jgi:serine protease Do
MLRRLSRRPDESIVVYQSSFVMLQILEPDHIFPRVISRIRGLNPRKPNEENYMKFQNLHRVFAAAALGLLLACPGATAYAQVQRTPVPQVIRIGGNTAYLGVEMEDVRADSLARYKLTNETGVIVRSVEKGSPAETARLLENDVILEYAGIPVFSAAELTRLVEETPIDRTVPLVVSRDGKKMSLSAKLGKRPSTGATAGEFNSIAPDFFWRTRPGTSGNLLYDFRNLPNGRGFLRQAGPRPQLGVTVEPLTGQMATFLGASGKRGVIVNEVMAGTPAAQVLKAGDIILSIDGKPVSTTSELAQAVAQKSPGARAELRIIRDKKEATVTVEIAKSATTRGVVIR